MTDVSEAESGTIGSAPKAPKKPKPKKKVVAKVKAKKASPKAKAKAKTKTAKNGRGGVKGVAPGGSKAAIAARKIHHKVIAGGKEYRSVADAFEKLKLPMAPHQAFRKALKAKGTLSFEKDSGKSVVFKLVKKD